MSKIITGNTRYGLEFGHGSFVGNSWESGLFKKKASAAARAAVFAWAEGCPVADGLITGRGAEEMEKRYGEITYWFGHILRTTQEINPRLHDQLMSPLERYEDEPPSAEHYERYSVPDAYLTEIGPFKTLWNYALPRIFIEQIEGRDGLPQDQQSVQDRLFRGQDILEEAITAGRNPVDLLVMLAEGLVVADSDSDNILRHILPRGALQRENAPYMWFMIGYRLKTGTSPLWDRYTMLSEAQKAELGIVADVEGILNNRLAQSRAIRTLVGRWAA